MQVRRRRVWIAAFVLAALAALVAIAVGLVRSGDGRLERLHVPSLYPPQCCAEIVGDEAGRAAIVWRESQGDDAGLVVAFLRADGWESPIRIPGSSAGDVPTAQGMLADGRVVVVWERRDERGREKVRAAVVGRGGDVATRTLFARKPGWQVALSVAGQRALLAWGWTEGDGTHIGVAEWDGRGWSVGVLAESPRRLPDRPSVAIDRDGNTLAVWWQAAFGAAGSTSKPVRAAYRAAGTPWPPPRTIARLGPDDVDALAPPTAMLLPGGRPVVSWATPWRGVPAKVSARELVDGRWRVVAPPRAPRTVTQLHGPGKPPTLVVLVDGGRQQHLTRVPTFARLLAAGRRVAFVWTEVPTRDRPLLDVAPQPVSYSELEHGGFSGPYGVGVESTSNASALLRPDGTLVVAYVGEGGVFAVTREPGYGWRPPVGVSP